MKVTFLERLYIVGKKDRWDPSLPMIDLVSSTLCLRERDGGSLNHIFTSIYNSIKLIVIKGFTIQTTIFINQLLIQSIQLLLQLSGYEPEYNVVSN